MAAIDFIARGLAAQATGRATATSNALRTGQKWCVVGDSITDYNSVRPNSPIGAYQGTAYSQSQGWMPWFLGLAQSPQILWSSTFDNFGVYGNTSTDLLARMTPILTGGYDTATLLIGTNDITSGISAGGDPVTILNTLKANYQNILAQMKAVNIRVICFTLIPRGDATGQTAPMRYCLVSFNSWLRNYCAVNELELFDAHRVLANPLSTTGGAITGTLRADMTHPSSYGAYLLGLALYNQLSSRTIPGSRLQCSPVDVYNSVNNLNGNLMPNAQFLTSQAMPTTITGLTTTGVMPSGYTFVRASGTASVGALVGSLVAAADGNGNVFRLDFTGMNGATEIFQLYAFISGPNVAAGDILDSWGGVALIGSLTGGVLSEISWGLQDSSASPAINYTAMANVVTGDTLPNVSFSTIWQLPADQVPTPTVAGTYTIRMVAKLVISVTGTFTGAVSFRLPTMRKRV